MALQCSQPQAEGVWYMCGLLYGMVSHEGVAVQLASWDLAGTSNTAGWRRNGWGRSVVGSVGSGVGWSVGWAPAR